jgi:hypothetical protein
MVNRLVMKGAAGALMALVAATSLSCSSTERGDDRGFVSIGRGAPLMPAIPAETWMDPADIEAWPPGANDGDPEEYWRVGPGDLAGSIIGAAPDGAVPAGIEPREVDRVNTRAVDADPARGADPRDIRGHRPYGRE